MRVLLVQPDYKRRGPDFAEGLLPARSLIELGALLESRGHEVTVLDPLVSLGVTGEDGGLDMPAALRALLEEGRFEAVGMAFYTPNRGEALELARTIKDFSRDLPVIAGGPHPARLSRSMLEGWREIDYVCMGAAEDSLCSLLDALSGGGGGVHRVRNIGYRRRSGMVRINGKASYHADLPGLPPVRYRSYLERVPGGRVKRAYVMTGRGCEYWCNFCSNLWKKLLLADPEAVAAEIAHLVRDCGAERIIIYDDCFGSRRVHAESVLKAILATGVEVELQAVTRFDVVDRGWLELFRRAGGRDILAGIETGSRRLRRKMNKHMRDEALCRGAELIREMGFRLGVYVMVGFPGETESDLEETRRLLKMIEPDQVMSSVFDIKPGDMLFEFSMSAEILSPELWLDADRRMVNDMSEEELELAAARAMAFDRIFTRQVIAPEHDPAGFILGIPPESIAAAVAGEEARWSGNAAV